MQIFYFYFHHFGPKSHYIIFPPYQRHQTQNLHVFSKERKKKQQHNHFRAA